MDRGTLPNRLGRGEQHQQQQQPITYGDESVERQSRILADLEKVVTADMDDFDCMKYCDAGVVNRPIGQPRLALAPPPSAPPMRTCSEVTNMQGSMGSGRHNDEIAPTSRGFVVTTAANLPPETLSRVQRNFEDGTSADVREASPAKHDHLPAGQGFLQASTEAGGDFRGRGFLHRLQTMRLTEDSTAVAPVSDRTHSPPTAHTRTLYPHTPAERKLESKLSLQSLPDLSFPASTPRLARTKTHVFTVGPEGRTLRATVSMPPLRFHGSSAMSSSVSVSMPINDTLGTDAKCSFKADADSAGSSSVGFTPASNGESKTRGSNAHLKRSGSHLGKVYCQINDCREDLSRAKIYCRRYKICSACIRRDSVVVAGREMRFCQQCSYLHPLTSFDGARHSCREKLAKHAKRVRRCRISSGKLDDSGMVQ